MALESQKIGMHFCVVQGVPGGQRRVCEFQEDRDFVVFVFSSVDIPPVPGGILRIGWAPGDSAE